MCVCPNFVKLELLPQFLGRPLIFSGIVDLPKTQKTVEQIFDLGPGFWATARNRPKMAQYVKIELLPQFYR